MLAAEAISQNTLNQEEAFSIRWILRNIKKKRVPTSCDHCNNPRGTFKDAQTKRKHIRETKRHYGCIGKAKFPVRYVTQDDDFTFNTCPHKIAKESRIYEYFRAYAWYDDKGIFPFGDFEDQSEKLVSVFETIRTEHRRIDEESLKEHSK